MSDIPPHIQRLLQQKLIEIAKIFVAPRITLIVRGPEVGNVKGDLVLGNDNPLYVERVLKARVVTQAEILAGTPERTMVVEKEKTEGDTGPRFDDGGNPANYQPKRAKWP
jgi:hypothetical protein